MEKEQAEQNADSEDESLIESQPLHQSLWDSKVPENFKSPQLPTFDGKTDPVEHLMVVTATSLFTIRQNYAETLREYLTRFSEATITVSNPNQEMFVATFHNGLKARHFNESLAQKPATSMQEVVKRRNWQNNDTHKQRYRAKPYYPHNVGGGMVTLNTGGLAPLPPTRMNNTVMGLDTEAWCAYHRCKGHDTERCFRLRDLIEDLIRSGHLRKFLEDTAKGQVALPKQIPYQQKGEGDGGNKGEKHRVAVNTISGGFVGGGESNSARKRYVRRSRFEIWSVGNSTFPHTPEISFNSEDGRDVIPHDDDPLVIQVQILNCDVKRVLIDSGSSADILYWDGYKVMRLSDEQLNPNCGTLVGFAGEQVNVIGHITLYTTFGEGENAKTIKVRYLMVKTPFTSYNIIIGRLAFNILGAVMSTLINMVSIKDLDPREELQDRRVSPIEDLEQVQIGEQPHQTTNVGTSLHLEEKERIIAILRNNRDLFAWQPSDMPEIDESVITHKLSISPANKPVVQQKRKVGEGRRASITENAYATYQRLMDRVFVEQIGKNLEVYIDDMVVKIEKEGEHDKDLDDILKSVRKYNMRLNRAKCSFGVQAGKFLGFLLISDPIFVRNHLNLSTTRHLLRLIYDKPSSRYILNSYPLQSIFTDTDTTVTRLQFPSDNIYNGTFTIYPTHCIDTVGCDGILCIANCSSFNDFKPLVVLWNPSIRKFKELPPFEYPPEVNCLYMSYAFGYDHVSRRYKVVVIYKPFYNSRIDCGTTKPKVYTLNNTDDSWRTIQPFPFDYVPDYRLQGRYLSSSNSINWMAFSKLNRQRCIISLDLGTESYQIISLPPGVERTSVGLRFCVLRDWLCVIFYHDVWVMKEYGIQESWTKLFNVTHLLDPPYKSFTLTNVLYLFQDDQLLLHFQKANDRMLILYNSKNDTSKSFMLDRIPEVIDKKQVDTSQFQESTSTVTFGSFGKTRSLTFTSGSVEVVHSAAALHCWPSPSNTEITPSFEKKRPDGPSSGNNARFTGHSAPSSMLKKPVYSFIEVLTKPGHNEFTRK
ncbi:hypothetical protein TSUD_100820 [Trifolium subterraneum]|uniref:Uncharacterized protein n=1 Tax=Trifolium subterraneum TaxID=3900 RepID=A0A2Z6NZV2_TRISU|nr:hypothetical protein TSUD_100820 [Trifolium subterraneum]